MVRDAVTCSFDDLPMNRREPGMASGESENAGKMPALPGSWPVSSSEWKRSLSTAPAISRPARCPPEGSGAMKTPGDLPEPILPRHSGFWVARCHARRDPTYLA